MVLATVLCTLVLCYFPLLTTTLRLGGTFGRNFCYDKSKSTYNTLFSSSSTFQLQSKICDEDIQLFNSDLDELSAWLKWLAGNTGNRRSSSSNQVPHQSIYNSVKINTSRQSLTEVDKETVATVFHSQLMQMDSTRIDAHACSPEESLSTFQSLSSCVWAIGMLNIKIDRMNAIDRRSSRKKGWYDVVTSSAAAYNTHVGLDVQPDVLFRM